MSFIDQHIIDQSPVLSGMETNEIELSIAYITPNIHTILLDYLTTTIFPLNKQLWKNDVITMIDFLMLPTNKLIDDCILFWQKYKINILQKYNINVPFSLAHKPKDIWCDIIVQYGALNVLKYVSKNGTPWSSKTSYIAAQYGQIDCLRYVRENGCPWNIGDCMFVAENGCHIECIKYIHSNGGILCESLSTISAQKGSVECLKYAHENGCPWNQDTCNNAAQFGKLDCLKYAHENGCPWNISTLILAIKNKHIDCFEYAHKNGCPWNETIWHDIMCY